MVTACFLLYSDKYAIGCIHKNFEFWILFWIKISIVSFRYNNKRTIKRFHLLY